MAKTRAIVKRRKAIRNIRKITRTMELIATARFRKAMDRAVAASAYTRRIGELVGDLGRSASATAHPLLEQRPVKKSLLLVLTSNRGLCGGYNASILRQAVDVLAARKAEHPVELEVSGKQAVSFFKYRAVPVAKSYLKFEDKPSFAEVDELASRYLRMFLDGEIDRLDVASMRFQSTAKQFAEVHTLLPLASLGGEPASAAGSAKEGDVEYEFMPSATDILNELVPVAFKVRLFKCFLDAAVSEQIARMVAMKGASENAGRLVKVLTQKYNRARQSQITSEIAEIIGAVNALS